MKKLIFLMENDDSLRENIIEWLELEGYQVKCIASDEAKSAFHNYHPEVAMLNQLTLSQSINDLIRLIKNKVDGIIVFCYDVENPV